MAAESPTPWRRPASSTATPATTTRSRCCSPPASDALDLRAITTVAGNGTLDKVTLNARKVCTLGGIRDVPIAAGADRARCAVRSRPPPTCTARARSTARRCPSPTSPLDPRPADELIADVVAAAEEPVTLIPIGPLTNVATVLDRHPDVTRNLREIVVMGGSTGRGNHAPYAEFNIYVDPEAAARVFESGVPLTMVGLNLTHQALATPAVVERLLGARHRDRARRRRGG